MNCSAFSDKKHTYLVAGLESHCQLYNVNSILVNEDDHVEEIGNNHEDLRHRKPRAKQKTDNNKNLKKKLKFNVKPADSVQTDFKESEPLNRVVRIHHTGKLMATGVPICFFYLKTCYKS